MAKKNLSECDGKHYARHLHSHSAGFPFSREVEIVKGRSEADGIEVY